MPASRWAEVDTMDFVEVFMDVRSKDGIVAARALERRPFKRFLRMNAVSLEIVAKNPVGTDVLVAEWTAPDRAMRLVTVQAQLASTNSDRALGACDHMVVVVAAPGAGCGRWGGGCRVGTCRRAGGFRRFRPFEPSQKRQDDEHDPQDDGSGIEC